ncbi:unnamed protein product [Rodentolepis nana]|uniref:Uncharacterized protein n=1 Tax=Rodentolepis nana TaxID=102285 RepID=A0A0R3TXM4_RODNA|nr:unnamed protein product [Rodentolepis nana]
MILSDFIPGDVMLNSDQSGACCKVKIGEEKVRSPTSSQSEEPNFPEQEKLKSIGEKEETLKDSDIINATMDYSVKGPPLPPRERRKSDFESNGSYTAPTSELEAIPNIGDTTYSVVDSMTKELEVVTQAERNSGNLECMEVGKCNSKDEGELSHKTSLRNRRVLPEHAYSLDNGSVSCGTGSAYSEPVLLYLDTQVLNWLCYRLIVLGVFLVFELGKVEIQKYNNSQCNATELGVDREKVERAKMNSKNLI